MKPSQRSRRGGTPPAATPTSRDDRNSPEAGAERPVRASPRVARRSAAEATGSPDALDIHFRQTRALPLATREDEIACARTAAGARRRKGGGASKCGRCEAGQCRLLEGTLRLVVAVAKQHQGMGLSLDDLIQEGNLGLACALRKYDPELGCFAAYASPWVLQKIHRAIDRGTLVHAPFRKLEAQRLEDRREAEARGRGESSAAPDLRSPSGEPAPETPPGKKPERVPDRRSFVSLDDSAEPDGLPFGALLCDPDDSDPALLLEAKEYGDLLDAALDDLPPRLREVLTRSFGLGGVERESLAAIGRSLNLSRERVRQLRKQALQVLGRNPRLAPRRY